MDKPVCQPLPDDGYVCYSPEQDAGAIGQTLEEAQAAWEQGQLTDLGSAAVNKWRGRGYL